MTCSRWTSVQRLHSRVQVVHVLSARIGFNFVGCVPVLLCCAGIDDQLDLVIKQSVLPEALHQEQPMTPQQLISAFTDARAPAAAEGEEAVQPYQYFVMALEVAERFSDTEVRRTAQCSGRDLLPAAHNLTVPKRARPANRICPCSPHFGCLPIFLHAYTTTRLPARPPTCRPIGGRLRVAAANSRRDAVAPGGSVALPGRQG